MLYFPLISFNISKIDINNIKMIFKNIKIMLNISGTRFA
jgi:hypothetical protein